MVITQKSLVCLTGNSILLQTPNFWTGFKIYSKFIAANQSFCIILNQFVYFDADADLDADL